MKTQEQVQNALDIKQKELADLTARLADLQVWLDSSTFMGNEQMFISCVSEREEKQRREQELRIQITFLKWVLG
jgi:hypothetical protein